MGNALILGDVLAVMVSDRLRFLIAEGQMLCKDEQATRWNVHVNKFLVDDVVDPAIANMPLARIGKVEWLAGHPHLAEIVKESNDDAAFLFDLRRESLSQPQKSLSDIDGMGK